MLVKIFLAAAVLLQSAAAASVVGPRDFHRDIEPRGWAPPMPKPPMLAPPECVKKEGDTTNQATACSSGAPYCCTSDGSGGQLCSNSTEICKTTIICCNNSNGFQMCIGNIDFNAPVTINVNACPGGGRGGGGGGGGGRKNGKRDSTPTID